ncbi:hypothetical protein ACSAZL_00765 [Methanosarcina sp. T3]|uniref:hypothetical protein n=1 Tax=Methanosarcina sp. T3 TaxID=3439062 RepID=UPI003F83CDFB
MWELNIFITLLLAIFILMAGSGIGSAAEIIVHSGESIQAAINNATEGDTIIVEPGTYHEDITVDTQDLIIKSKSGNPDYTKFTGHFGIGFMNTNLGTIFDGFTLQGNYSAILKEKA